MPKVFIDVPVSDLVEALGLERLPVDSTLRPGQLAVEMEVSVDQDVIDDEATEVEPEPIRIDEGDLRDGFRALFAGDLPLARTLLQRAMDDDDNAKRVIEEELRAAGRKRAA